MKTLIKLFLALALIGTMLVLNGCPESDNPLSLSKVKVKAGGSFDSLYKDGEYLVYEATLFLSDEDHNALKNIKAKNLRAYLEYDYSTSSPKRILGSHEFNTYSSTGRSIAAAMTMDYSGSMRTNPKDIPLMEEAVEYFINLSSNTDIFEIIKFNDNITVIQPFTNDKTLLQEAIKKSYSGSSTALHRSIETALENTSLISRQSYNRAVIAFTDGENSNNLGGSKESVIQKANDLGIPVFCIGLGSVNVGVLSEISDKTGGFNINTPTSEQLKDIYQRISGVFQNSYRIKARWKISDLPPGVCLAKFFVKVVSDGGSELAEFTDNKEHNICNPGSGGTGGYETVTIGNQVWMKKNLDIATYRNGDPIPEVTDPIAWANLTTGAWCYYKSQSGTSQTQYGKLYNWYAVNDPRGLAPAGWRVPSNSEWNTLESYLGDNAGAKLAGNPANWDYGDLRSSNDFGTTNFMGLPGGGRGVNSIFQYENESAYWWTSTQYNVTLSYVKSIDYKYTIIRTYESPKINGFSVRCIKE